MDHVADTDILANWLTEAQLHTVYLFAVFFMHIVSFLLRTALHPLCLLYGLSVCCSKSGNKINKKMS